MIVFTIFLVVLLVMFKTSIDVTSRGDILLWYSDFAENRKYIKLN